MVTKVLCVAEKPSIAKAVANHLAGQAVTGTAASRENPWLRYYEFEYTFATWGRCNVVMTSVAGHLQSQDFDARFRPWQNCQPEELFDAQIVTYTEDQKKHIVDNIEKHARYASKLFIWTDCDREGEHIGTEIRSVASAVNSRLATAGNVFRAKFSNIERQHIIQAAQNPITLDERQANAVAARIELDLRIGASFTRMQTLTLKPMLQAIDEEIKAVSYGSCQFPTLGFVVDRYFQVKNFIPEPFWSIKVVHAKDEISVEFSWARHRLFDRMIAVVLFERCLAAKYAKVTKVQQKPTSKWKPLPLTTVELQKLGSRYLRMDSQSVMKIAEELYQKGWISYPRTETDQFDKGIDLKAIIEKQTQSPNWGQYAQSLLDGDFRTPRNGSHNDKAHPPIHPVNYVNSDSLNSDDRRVLEFIVRRFLACCSEDAKGTKAEVAILYGNESFEASGLTVLEKNYLDVYPYEKWTSTKELPPFAIGETFEPNEARVTDGKTTKPGYLTEPELIGLMDANGIGTDATMAEHIAKIKHRKYVQTVGTGRSTSAPATRGRGSTRGRGRGRGGSSVSEPPTTSSTGVNEFIPTTLGVALYEGYENMGFETSLTKPFLRKEMELRMRSICDGNVTKSEVVFESLNMYRELYIRTTQQIEILKTAVRKYLFPADNAA